MRKIHFIGIGGIGMSALASIYLSWGHRVAGSDLKLNNLTEKLSQGGALIFEGHSAGNVKSDFDIVVRSACIRENNPEVIAARKLNIPVISRSELLRKVLHEFNFSLVVTGTHGKTTTSSLIACIMERIGKNPTVVVGGETELFDGNAKQGEGGMIVAELDESDGYFRNVSSTCAVVTNVEEEHMENYGSFENLKKAYGELIGKICPDGFFVFNGEDAQLNSLKSKTKAKKISFGINGDFDVTCQNYSWKDSIAFDLIISGKNYARIESPLIGRHNMMNILAAVAACTASGTLAPGAVLLTEALKSFKGVKRRFELMGKVGGIRVIEDYAHHPTELKAVITAAAASAPARLICVFQPHRYTRTRDLMNEFSKCFDMTDVLVLTPIYPAGEEKIEGISSRVLCDKIDSALFEKLTVMEKKNVSDFLAGFVKENDTILILGAGDIREISKEVISSLADELTAGRKGVFLC
ncbi:MAG: UDP-N-acetylmuramate--L-alanine ligase [Candidatus Omnitrophota bacterium]